MTKQEMKNEAIARMRMLKIYSNAIRDFQKKDRVLNKSEGYGALYYGYMCGTKPLTINRKVDTSE